MSSSSSSDKTRRPPVPVASWPDFCPGVPSMQQIMIDHLPEDVVREAGCCDHPTYNKPEVLDLLLPACFPFAADSSPPADDVPGTPDQTGGQAQEQQQQQQHRHFTVSEDEAALLLSRRCVYYYTLCPQTHMFALRCLPSTKTSPLPHH